MFFAKWFKDLPSARRGHTILTYPDSTEKDYTHL